MKFIYRDKVGLVVNNEEDRIYASVDFYDELTPSQEEDLEFLFEELFRNYCKDEPV